MNKTVPGREVVSRWGKAGCWGRGRSTEDPGERLRCFEHSSGAEFCAWNKSFVHKTGTWCRNASSFYHRRKKGTDRLCNVAKTSQPVNDGAVIWTQATQCRLFRGWEGFLEEETSKAVV